MLNHKLKIILFLTCLAISLKGFTHNLPDLGSPGLVTYDRQTEIKLGRAFTQALHTEVDLVKDPEVLSYVRRIGHRLAEHAQDGRNYRFYVISDPSINAFAGPDGIIGIHSGLILAAESEDELASVIAHEIAHVTQQHLARRFEQQSALNITSFASLLAAILIGSQNPGAGVAAMMGATGLSIQEQLRYSRIHEHEADHFGIELLHKSGYNPHAMADFFGKLSKQQQIHEFRPPEILMTHPVTDTRLAQASNRAAKLTPYITRHDSINLALVQIRLSNQIKPNSNPIHLETLRCYQSSIQHTTASSTALDCLNQSLANHPNNRLLKTQLLRIKIEKEMDHSLNELNKLLELYPQDEAMLLITAQIYREQGKTQAAQQLILNNIHNKRYSFELYQELSQNFAAQQQWAEAYLFEAQAHLALGNFERAKHLIKQSKTSLPSISPELAKQQASIEQQLNP
ncbi:M48 family metalloprotease [Thiomicrospira microaerophila]|uniref:M48 family metallopeptidase n=1 Tax=Thiomicrospira microaerophila TaxID=406020 RepID=UPI00200D46FA|nr:M48 family metalloprotease [Thiomicrospira microaerophila]UQB41828.1 M48 family metalloprotease [Thiomicrospira microaerophila]